MSVVAFPKHKRPRYDKPGPEESCVIVVMPVVRVERIVDAMPSASEFARQQRALKKLFEED